MLEVAEAFERNADIHLIALFAAKRCTISHKTFPFFADDGVIPVDNTRPIGKGLQPEPGMSGLSVPAGGRHRIAFAVHFHDRRMEPKCIKLRELGINGIRRPGKFRCRIGDLRMFMLQKPCLPKGDFFFVCFHNEIGFPIWFHQIGLALLPNQIIMIIHLHQKLGDFYIKHKWFSPPGWAKPRYFRTAISSLNLPGIKRSCWEPNLQPPHSRSRSRQRPP